jgi:hypothetical protein
LFCFVLFCLLTCRIVCTHCGTAAGWFPHSEIHACRAILPVWRDVCLSGLHREIIVARVDRKCSSDRSLMAYFWLLVIYLIFIEFVCYQFISRIRTASVISRRLVVSQNVNL